MNSTDLEILDEKLNTLEQVLKGYGSVAVAFSGGVDSTFLLEVAHRTLKDKCIAITAKSPSFPNREKDESEEFCKSHDIKQVIFETTEMDDERYVKNDRDRCYYCKSTLFSQMKKLAAEYGIKEICEGSNMDDMGDYRPGLRAVEEQGAKSPLREAKLTKEDIRVLSKEMGLPTWNKSAFACLASRVPYGERITENKLSMVERAEDVLRIAGFTQYRVRAHGNLARIEVLADDMASFMEKRTAISAGIRAAGFKFVSLDLDGYKQGSMNRDLG